MKKIIIALVLVALVVPMVSLAADVLQDCCKIGREIVVDDKTCDKDAIVSSLALKVDCPGPLGSVTCSTEKWGLFCSLNTIYTVIDWVFLFLVLIVIVLTVIGGFEIMMAKDTATGITAGREKILAAAIGLIVALMAKMVPSLIKAILGYA